VSLVVYRNVPLSLDFKGFVYDYLNLPILAQIEQVCFLGLQLSPVYANEIKLKFVKLNIFILTTTKYFYYT